MDVETGNDEINLYLIQDSDTDIAGQSFPLEHSKVMKLSLFIFIFNIFYVGR